MGRGRVLRLRLAHVRRRLVRVRRRRRLPAGLLRCGMTSIMRDSGILRTRSGRITRTRCALMFRRTRYAIRLRGGIAMRRRLGLVHVRLEDAAPVSQVLQQGRCLGCGQLSSHLAGGRSVVVRRLFGLSGWRMRNSIVRVRCVVRRIWMRDVRIVVIGCGRTLGRMRNVVVARMRSASVVALVCCGARTAGLFVTGAFFAATTPAPWKAVGLGVAATSGRPWFTDAHCARSLRASSSCWVCTEVALICRSRAAASWAALGLAVMPPWPPL